MAYKFSDKISYNTADGNFSFGSEKMVPSTIESFVVPESQPARLQLGINNEYLAV